MGSEPKDNNGRKINVSFISSVIGLITSAIIVPFGVWTVVTIFTLQEKQSVTMSQMETLKAKVGTIETSGTSNFQAHEKFDDERVANLKSRLNVVENAIVILTDVKERMAVINTKLETINDTTRFLQTQLNDLVKRLDQINPQKTGQPQTSSKPTAGGYSF